MLKADFSGKIMARSYWNITCKMLKRGKCQPKFLYLAITLSEGTIKTFSNKQGLREYNIYRLC